MSKLYIHHVGEAGARRDFPRTVYTKISTKHIEEHLDTIPQSEDLIRQINQAFPSGECNVWGVPSGAVRVINNLQVDDYVLLMSKSEAIGDGRYDGDVES